MIETILRLLKEKNAINCTNISVKFQEFYAVTILTY